MVALEARKPNVEALDVDGIGTVHVREITPRDMDSFEMLMADSEKGRRDWTAAFCVRVLCDEKGERLFHDTDLALLSERASVKALNQIWAAGRRVSGLDRASQEQAEKNSDGAQSANSGTV